MKKPLKNPANKFMRMTGNRFLLDTNIIAAWLKGAEPIADKTDRAVEVYIPIIMLGEIYY